MSADDLTKHYHSKQGDTREDVVDLFKRDGDEGDNADLTTWAAKDRTALEHDLMTSMNVDRE
ncbi:hypothetical protein HGP17_10545 [Rhizobium sp. P38BS-XIX]|uniref:hypothetical protein n=1 Tax=Rhizobium sp. P38BS-XIX TaxID=2726740 RepID=UPI00145645C2|nr:hypothetical protein [Rhizobium sp. P38BS-XIX]NLR97270.1 hypothetical protein [Rhizobium sp. P38BS-XIX]